MLDRLKKQLGIKDTPVSLEAQELQTKQINQRLKEIKCTIS